MVFVSLSCLDIVDAFTSEDPLSKESEEMALFLSKQGERAVKALICFAESLRDRLMRVPNNDPTGTPKLVEFFQNGAPSSHLNFVKWSKKGKNKKSGFYEILTRFPM